MGGNQNVLRSWTSFSSTLPGGASLHSACPNEPDFCAPYAYVWTGNPWKTQEVADRIRRETFTTKPDGLPGNDDLGATSGWYIWNALGMYPVIPGVGGLVLGTPMFPHAVMKLGSGKVLEIASSGEGIYVQSVELNGIPYESAWLPLDKLQSGHNRLHLNWRKNPITRGQAGPRIFLHHSTYPKNNLDISLDGEVANGGFNFMRADIIPGAIFPNYELTDHTGKPP